MSNRFHHHVVARTPNRFFLPILTHPICLLILISTNLIHCSWTPEIETPLHESQEGTIVLQTTQAFHIPPKHPIDISDTILQDILSGIMKKEERGILQELLSGPPKPVPLFSSSQKDFLAPQLTLALSKVTQDEVVAFSCHATEENSFSIQGTVAFFPPSFFLMTIKNPGNSLVVHQKGTNVSGLLQDHFTLEFSEPNAVLPTQKTREFMTNPSNSNWIGINLDYEKSLEPGSDPGPTSESDSLKKQIQELHQKTEEQAEEIHRLKKTLE